MPEVNRLIGKHLFPSVGSNIWFAKVLRISEWQNRSFGRLFDCSVVSLFTSVEGGVVSFIILKVTISLIVIGLKNSYFPLIHLPSCYRTVCYWTVCYRTVQ